jgi:hypothetical protein
MKKENVHTTREGWLLAAVELLRAYFAKLGYTLPDMMRFTIGFTSGGKRGMEGECWHPPSSADKHYEIIIKISKDDPLEILGILTHELLHALLPPTVKHGKEFRDIALRVGLEGKMAHAMPAPPLQERLAAMASALGPFPHAALEAGVASDRKKKQSARLLKAECGTCGYAIRVTAKWARRGLPICPADAKHGRFKCKIPEDELDDEIEPNET